MHGLRLHEAALCALTAIFISPSYDNFFVEVFLQINVAVMLMVMLLIVKNTGIRL